MTSSTPVSESVGQSWVSPMVPLHTYDSPRPINRTAGPLDAELWEIEAEADLLAAELALVDAESAWYRNPTPETAADYLDAVAEVIDLHTLYGYGPARSLVVRDAVREVA